MVQLLSWGSACKSYGILPHKGACTPGQQHWRWVHTPTLNSARVEKSQANTICYCLLCVFTRLALRKECLSVLLSK